jgi:hypothetical protein
MGQDSAMGRDVRWRGVVWSLLVTVVLAELTSALGLKLIHRPIYWTSESLYGRPIVYPLKSEKDPWGAWGIPNSTSRMVSECYDVEYRFNSVGARDKERQVESPERWIVLGDSMIEGYGIEQNERITDILEKRLGWQFANLAGAGDFGPLQYLLVYRGIGKKFEHNGVIVGLLPFNDFTDNDPEWWKANKNQLNQNRYRPYAALSSDSRSYNIIYGVDGDATPRVDFNSPPTVDQASTPSKNRQNAQETIRDFVKGLSQVSATFSLLRQVIREFNLRNSPFYWSYFIADARKIATVKLVMDDLSREIGSRPKILLLLPVHEDLVERRRRKVNYGEEVDRFLRDLGSDGWTIIDTAEIISEIEQSRDVTLGCDPHWNPETNRIVAEFILMNFRENLTGAPVQGVQPR